MTTITKQIKLTRSEQTEQKKQLILDAALHEFSAHGYEGSRMEAIAQKAGVAKGTVFLHFTDKATLFIELVKLHVLPVFSQLSTEPNSNKSLKIQIEELFLPIAEQLMNSKASPIIQLIWSEGKRFPELTKLYYDLVVSKAFQQIQYLVEVGITNQTLPPSTPLREFPHLLVSPIIFSFFWQHNFQQYHPIDFPGMFRAHLALHFPEEK